MVRGLLVIIVALFAWPAAAQTGRQQEPGLKAVIEAAIRSQPCFEEKYDDVVWYSVMQPRVEQRLRARARGLSRDTDFSVLAQRILRAVHCESKKHRMLRERPQLVLAVIDIESAFDSFAISSAGAIGLMQVMPFWPRELGLRNEDLLDVELNVRMGTSILAHYMEKERGDHVRALARYNGSLGKRWYPDKVMTRLTYRWQF